MEIGCGASCGCIYCVRRDTESHPPSPSIHRPFLRFFTQMDERGSSMTDAQPLVKIKQSLTRLKTDIREMDLRIGVVSRRSVAQIFLLGAGTRHQTRSLINIVILSWNVFRTVGSAHFASRQRKAPGRNGAGHARLSRSCRPLWQERDNLSFLRDR